jgi:hypothetical protein
MSWSHVLHPERQRDGELGLADPVPAEFGRGGRRLLIRRNVDETPAFQEVATGGEVPRNPVRRRHEHQATGVHAHVLWVVGSITLGLAILSAIAAFTARETFMIHLIDCGEVWAQPVSAAEYARARLSSVA